MRFSHFRCYTLWHFRSHMLCIRLFPVYSLYLSLARSFSLNFIGLPCIYHGHHRIGVYRCYCIAICMNPQSICVRLIICLLIFNAIAFTILGLLFVCDFQNKQYRPNNAAHLTAVISMVKARYTFWFIYYSRETAEKMAGKSQKVFRKRKKKNQIMKNWERWKRQESKRNKSNNVGKKMNKTNSETIESKTHRL